MVDRRHMAYCINRSTAMPLGRFMACLLQDRVLLDDRGNWMAAYSDHDLDTKLTASDFGLSLCAFVYSSNMDGRLWDDDESKRSCHFRVLVKKKQKPREYSRTNGPVDLEQQLQRMYPPCTGAAHGT